MKKVLFIFIILAMITGVANAKTFVVYNSDNTVATVSAKNDTVLYDGQNVVMYNDKFSDFCEKLAHHPSMYRLVGSELVYDEKLAPDSFRLDMQALEGELFTAFSKHTNFAAVYSPIKSCFGYLSYPYEDTASVTALATLEAYCDGLVHGEAFSNSEYNTFKTILAKYKITIGG